MIKENLCTGSPLNIWRYGCS